MLDISLELKGKSGELNSENTLAACLRRSVPFLIYVVRRANLDPLVSLNQRSSVKRNTAAVNAAKLLMYVMEVAPFLPWPDFMSSS